MTKDLQICLKTERVAAFNCLRKKYRMGMKNDGQGTQKKIKSRKRHLKDRRLTVIVASSSSSSLSYNAFEKSGFCS